MVYNLGEKYTIREAFFNEMGKLGISPATKLEWGRQWRPTGSSVIASETVLPFFHLCALACYRCACTLVRIKMKKSARALYAPILVNFLNRILLEFCFHLYGSKTSAIFISPSMFRLDCLAVFSDPYITNSDSWSQARNWKLWCNLASWQQLWYLYGICYLREALPWFVCYWAVDHWKFEYSEYFLVSFICF